eukprot:gene1880-2202_t
MTASVLEAHRQASSAAGMDGFASKPVDWAQLSRELARVLALAAPAAPQTLEAPPAAILPIAPILPVAPIAPIAPTMPGLPALHATPVPPSELYGARPELGLHVLNEAAGLRRWDGSEQGYQAALAHFIKEH